MNLMGGLMFTTFISTEGTTFPKTHQDLSLSFLWSDLEEWAFVLFKACFLYHVGFFFFLNYIVLHQPIYFI